MGSEGGAARLDFFDEGTPCWGSKYTRKLPLDPSKKLSTRSATALARTPASLSAGSYTWSRDFFSRRTAPFLNRRSITVSTVV